MDGTAILRSTNTVVDFVIRERGCPGDMQQ